MFAGAKFVYIASGTGSNSFTWAAPVPTAGSDKVDTRLQIHVSLGLYRKTDIAHLNAS